MLTILDEFLTRSDSGREMMLCECLVENDVTTQHDASRRIHRDRYFRQADGFMRAKRADEIEPGVFQVEDEDELFYRV